MIAAALHQVRRPEHLPDGLAQRLGAVDDEQPPTVRPQTPCHQVLQQADGHRRVLRRATAKTQHVLPAVRIHPHRRQHVVVRKLDPVKVDHQHVQLAQIPFRQLLKNASPRLDGLPRYLGLADAHLSYRKRHHYLTVVVDHDTRRVVWAGKGRSAETLDAFFNLLGPSGCEGIALVTVDLAASWQKALRARVPHARVVFDRFHVERLASDAVDEVRRAEQRRVGAKAAKALKGTRFCLLKHPARLKPGEKRRLETLRRQNRALDRAYRLKEYLATILEQATPDEASDLLDEWLAWAARSRLRPIVKLRGRSASTPPVSWPTSTPR